MKFIIHTSWVFFRKRWVSWLVTVFIALAVVIYLVISAPMEGIRYFWMDQLVGARADFLLQVRDDPYGIRDEAGLTERLKKIDVIRGAAPYCENPCLFFHDHQGLRSTRAPGLIRGIDIVEEYNNGRLKDYLEMEADDIEFKRYYPVERRFRGIPLADGGWIELPSAVKKEQIRNLRRHALTDTYEPYARFLYSLEILTIFRARPDRARDAVARLDDAERLDLIDAMLDIDRRTLPETDPRIIHTDDTRAVLSNPLIWERPQTELDTDDLAVLRRVTGSASKDTTVASAVDSLYACAERLMAAQAYQAALDLTRTDENSDPDAVCSHLSLDAMATMPASKIRDSFGTGAQFSARKTAFFETLPDAGAFKSIPPDDLNLFIAMLHSFGTEYSEEKLAQIKNGCIIGSTWRERYSAAKGDTILVILGEKPEQSEQFVVQGFRKDAQARFGLMINVDFRVARRFFAGLYSRGGSTMTEDEKARASAVRGISVWIKDLNFDETDTDRIRADVADAFDAHILASDEYHESKTGQSRYHYRNNIQTKTWKEFDPDWYIGINRQNQIMRFLMLAVVCAISCFILFINWVMVKDKTRDIGLLRACGASRPAIVGVFLLEGFYAGLAGIAVGLPAGIFIVRETIINGLEARFNALTGIGLNPVGGMLDKIPSKLMPYDVQLICGMMLATTLIAALIPALLAARVDPVKTLHYE